MFHEDQIPLISSPNRIKSKVLLEKKEKFVARGISTAYPLIVDEAHGAVIKDIDGNAYLDFMVE